MRKDNFFSLKSTGNSGASACRIRLFRERRMQQLVEGYEISTDKSRLSLDAICSMLSKSYWASERPVEVIKKSIENSICFGIYHDSEQVGFARAVTDYATIFWMADLIIHEAHRGKGLGKELVRTILETKEIQGLPGILMTKDAHGLYEQFGFFRTLDRGMARLK